MKLFTLLLVFFFGLSVTAEAAWMPSSKSNKSVAWAVGDSVPGRISNLVQSSSRYFFYLGDVYETGTYLEFQTNYPFGSLAHKTAPTIGNHEWGNRFLGYYPFWTKKRGSSPNPYYSFWVSGWQVIVLNSEDDLGYGSNQYSWLYDRISKNRRQGSCRVIISHRPRWSAGSHGDNDSLKDAVSLLSGRARVWLSGHDHNMQYIYKNGINQFVSGAGGKGHYPIDPAYPGLKFSNTEDDGALRLVFRKLTNKKRSLTWQFYSTKPDKLKSGQISCQRL